MFLLRSPHSHCKQASQITVSSGIGLAVIAPFRSAAQIRTSNHETYGGIRLRRSIPLIFTDTLWSLRVCAKLIRHLLLLSGSS